MKKIISDLLNVLSIISAVIMFGLSAFCAYDWISLSKTAYSYTLEFWLVIDYYSRGIMIFSIAGFVMTLFNCIISTSENIKKISKILCVIFGVVTVAAIALYILPISF